MGIEILARLWSRSFIQLGVNITVTNGEIMERSIDIRQQQREATSDEGRGTTVCKTYSSTLLAPLVSIAF